MFSSDENGIKNRVIVIAEDIDLRVVYGLKYSKTISDDVIVFGTYKNDMDEQIMRSLWNKLQADYSLILRHSPDGGIVEPLLDFLVSPEFGIGTDEIVTVALPRLVSAGWWHRLLDNKVSKYIERRLSKYEQIKVEVVPVQLEDDDSVLGSAALS